jgi:transposase
MRCVPRHLAEVCQRDLIGARPEHVPRLRRVRWRGLACPSVGPSGKGDLEVIVVGIDPHKKTHTAAAATAVGEPVAEVTIKARLQGYERLLAWARELDEERLFALEDCRHVSGNLERFLVARSERVVRVPPKLMAGARRSARTAGKSDGVDALAVAHAALRQPELPQARLAGIERDIKQLLDHREDQVWERTRIQQRLRWHLHDIDPSFEIPERALDRFCWLDRIEKHLTSQPASTAVRIALELVDDCRRITRRVNELERELTTLVGEHFPELVAMPGCGALSAAKLVGEIAGIERFPSDSKLAMHAGVGPLEASSGNRQALSPQSQGQPSAEHRSASHRGDAKPDARTRPEVHRQEDAGRQEQERSAEVSQETPCAIDLPHSEGQNDVRSNRQQRRTGFAFGGGLT